MVTEPERLRIEGVPVYDKRCVQGSRVLPDAALWTNGLVCLSMKRKHPGFDGGGEVHTYFV